MNILQFKSVVFAFIVVLLIISGAMTLVEHHFYLQNFIENQIEIRKEGDKILLPALIKKVKKRRYLTVKESRTVNIYLMKLKEINGKSLKDVENLFIFSKRLENKNIVSGFNGFLIKATAWGIIDRETAHLLQERISAEHAALMKIKKLEREFADFIDQNLQRYSSRIPGVSAEFENNKNIRLDYLRDSYLHYREVNNNIMELLKPYAEAASQSHLRLFTYVLFTIILSLIALMIYTLQFFMRPLKIMDEVSNSVINQNRSLKDIHIPFLGNNPFGRLGLAMRKLLTYIAEIDVVKGNIMSQVTHDLKSPLGTIKQGLDILKDASFGEMNEKQTEIVNLMYSGYNSMNSLISKLVDAAKLEYNSYRVEYEKFDLIKLIKSIFNEFYFDLVNKNIKIYFKKPKWQSFYIVADRAGLQNVMRNLLSNAVKFSPENSKITVKLGLKDYDVYLSISDEGIGIPPEEQDKIFDKLYRARNSGEISVKGTGLGLFIVKNIIQKHNGEIVVKSTLHKGTTFEIHFPRFQTVQANIKG